MDSVLFSSDKQTWKTPEWLYKKLDGVFHFDHDPALTTRVDWANDGLNTSWGKRTYCNPPYIDLNKWIAKGYREFQSGKLVVFLIPSRTDTQAWHDYCMKASEIWFIRGRITFEGAKAGAPFPSCVVVFDPSYKGQTIFKSVDQRGDIQQDNLLFA